VLFLSGAVYPPALTDRRLGVMLQPKMGNRMPPDVLWAADNGCFSQGDRFNLPAYYRWLEARQIHQDRCLFAVAPDVVGDAEATWRRSRDVLPELRARGYRAALVAQDDVDPTTLDWSAFDVLFIGGTTRWKLSEPAYEIAAEAKRRGKWIHLGRVNSAKRLIAAAMAGYDSADGTFLAFGPDKNLPRLLSWLDRLDRQPVMRLEVP
jgi:hypothetical protein